MTPSELKRRVEEIGENPHFFARETMRFFGDSMKNYGCRRVTVRAEYYAGEYVEGGVLVHCWELYRKRPVKHGNLDSAYFSAENYSRVFPLRAIE